jgi:hypothetical protein
MASTDLFRRRANECRRLAAAARNANDKAFWAGLVERWQAARQRCLKEVLTGDFKQKHSPGNKKRLKIDQKNIMAGSCRQNSQN